VKVFVIAEAGVNHNGDTEMAFALVDAVADAGADAVKFQTFKAEELASVGAPKAAYQNDTTDAAESQFDMLKNLELTWDMHCGLMDHCDKRDITFLSTPFDITSLTFLAGTLKLKTLKIPSGEITNGPLLLAAGESGCGVILSTGMSTLDEVEEALGVLAFGMTGDGPPSLDAFQDTFASDAGQAVLKNKVTLLHCTTEYPTPFADANLNAMHTMRDAFGLRVGLSDHTPGISVPIAATALGAEVIEKHFTMDRMLPGPDHKASLEPDELKAMVEGIRNVEKALGDGIKTPQPSEQRNRKVVRKSLITLKPIKAGEAFTEQNLGAKRPGGGLSPMEYWDRLSRKAERGYSEGEQL